MIIAIYIIFLFLILRFTVTLFNFISDPKLRRVNRDLPDLVSILIPVRNEEDNILTLLNSVLQQEHGHYEVIILDDDSTDGTYQLCSDFCDKHPQFRFMKGEPLPNGWLGKNFACHQLAKAAKGKYLLFVDADEQLYRGLISAAVYRMQLRKLALLSLFTDQDMRTIGERMVVPLMHYVLLNLLPIKLIYLSKNPSFSAASGQFMLFDAAVYKRYQWHEMARDRVVEDVEIMKLLKWKGEKGESLLANGLISCRMYTGFSSAISGFSKNFLAAFNYNIFGFICYLLVILGGPMLIFATLNVQLILMLCGLIILTRIMISLSSGQNAFYNVVLHPLQMLSLLILGISAIQNHLTRKNVWKGRPV